MEGCAAGMRFPSLPGPDLRGGDDSGRLPSFGKRTRF